MACRYKVEISYDGTLFYGLEKQIEKRTIEGEIEKSFYQLLKHNVKIVSSGRTDRFVHAYGQVFHVDLEENIPPSGLKRGLNSVLPDDIYVLSCEIVDDNFHARFSVKNKEYHYLINTGDYDPLKRNYMIFQKNLDIPLMKEALKLFEGTHDFKAYASNQIDKRKPTIRTIYYTDLKYEDNLITIIFNGDGFLKYQVRRMVALLIDIALHKEDISRINEVFKLNDPKVIHKSAKGCGLYLYKVNY